MSKKENKYKTLQMKIEIKEQTNRRQKKKQ